MTQVEQALANVTTAASKRVNYLALFLAGKAFAQTLVGAAAFSDMVGSRTAGLILVTVSALDSAYAVYLTAANRKDVGSVSANG